MRINLLNTGAVVITATLSVLSPAWAAGSAAEVTAAEQTAEQTADQLVRLEKRLAELEARLAEAEQDTKEVKVLATAGAGNVGSSSVLANRATYDILANSAWRNLRWTQEEQWAGIRKGISEEKVVELLGAAPRSVKSLKPRVDKVLYYETSLRDDGNTLRGKISFKDGVVIAVSKPKFQAQKRAQ